MKPAISYCRVSTRKQSEEGASLQTQSVANRELANSLGLIIGKEFLEVYTGGELYDRPKLNEVRDLVKSGQYGMLICHSIDRLSRDAVHLMILAEECDRAGVELRFVTEALDDTPEGKLIQYVRGYAAQVEREKRREQAIRGRRAVVLSGKIHNAGIELYGYRRDKANGKREIYEPEAIVVRRIFEMMAQGIGARVISERLNREGVPSPSVGKRSLASRHSHHWGKSQVARMLHDEAYKGQTIAWRWKSARKKGNVIRRDAKDHIQLPEGVTPAIVTPKLWQAANEMIAKNRGEVKRNETRQYLLRGYLFCAECGQRMYTDPNKGLRAYRCSSRNKVSGKCGALTVRADWVEEWAWNEMTAFINNPQAILDAMVRVQKGDKRKHLTSELERTQRQLSRIEAQQQRLVKRLRVTDDDDLAVIIEKELKQAEDEKRLVARAIDFLKQQMDAQVDKLPSLAALARACEPFARCLARAEFEDKRLALQAFRVRVYASGKPGENWKMQIVPGGEPDTSSKYYSQNTVWVSYRKRRKAA